MMNLHLLLAWPTLLGLGGLRLVAWVLSRGKIGEWVRHALAPDLDFLGHLFLLSVGAFTSFAFNDSGGVSALLLLIPLGLAVTEKAVSNMNPYLLNLRFCTYKM
jgi:di/tricarboxylate transporter